MLEYTLVYRRAEIFTYFSGRLFLTVAIDTRVCMFPFDVLWTRVGRGFGIRIVLSS